jgi:hypothetical protein
MSAVHRIDDIEAMPAAEFFELAWRLPHYRGVMRERVLAWQQEAESSGQQAQPGRTEQPQQAVQRSRPAQVEPVTREALSDPVLSTIFSFG